MYENAITPDYIRLMAIYNQSVNRSLYAICAGLSEEQRHQEFPVYFKSIHGILNHMLWADNTWLGRFKAIPFHGPGYGGELYADFADLRTAREETDQEIRDWAETVSPEWFVSSLVWTSRFDGKQHTDLCSLLALHLFNHQTYHRGQLSVLLNHLGHDGPSTDLPWLPEFNPSV
jgi:uncharacterized damage-inducible protein DinB